METALKRIIRAMAVLVTRLPKTVLAVSLVLTAILGAIGTGLDNDAGQNGFSPESDEILASERIGELFGDGATQSVMQVVVRSSSGDVLTAEALGAVHAITEAIATSDGGAHVSMDPADPGVVSFLMPVQMAVAMQQLDPALLDDASVKAIYNQVVAEVPEAAIATRLVPADSGDTPSVGLLIVRINGSSDLDDQVAREVSIADAIRAVPLGDDLEVRPFSFSLLFGGDEDFLGEIGQLFITAFLIITAVLLFVFWMKPVGNTRAGTAIRRTLADTSVTMLTIVLVIAWMNGIGTLLQRIGLLGPLTEVAQIVPILLIALGIDYSIHLMSRYRDEVGEGRGVNLGMAMAIRTVGVALVLATVTTAVGFLTNVVNPIPALRDFGILAAVGIVASFALMMTFVPALRILLDRRAEAGRRLPVDGMNATGDRLLPGLAARTSVLAEKLPIPTLVVTILLGGLGYLGLSNLPTEFSFTDFLPEDSPIVETLTIIEEEFAGGFGETTQVLIEGDLASPEAFNALGAAVVAMTDTPDVLTVPTPVGAMPLVSSPVSVIQQLLVPGEDGMPAAGPQFAAAVMGAGLDPATGQVAPDGDVAAIYAAARAAAPKQMAAVLADGDVAALLEISTTAGEDRAIDLRDALVGDIAVLDAAGLETVVTSQNIITGTIIDSLSSSQVISLLITLIIATLVLMVNFAMENRRPMLGVLTMLPVALVVLWTFGLMYVSGIPFGPVTATLTGLAVGIGVPYTIHVARRFEEDRLRYDDPNLAIRETIRNTGGALAGSAITTAAGFGILMSSSLKPFQQMGQVTAYAIILSLLAAILVLPSLLVLWERWHRGRSPSPAVPEREEPVTVG